MRQMILAVAFAAVALPAFAQQQPANRPANRDANTPAVNTPNSPPNPGAPVAGANSFTEGQAKSRIETNGFTNVSDLQKDGNGVWRGKAIEGGNPSTSASISRATSRAVTACASSQQLNNRRNHDRHDLTALQHLRLKPAAVRALEAAGVAHGDISIIASNADKWYKDATKRQADTFPDRDLDGKDDRAEAAGTGAGIGAAAGGTAGLLAGLGLMAIPGVGPVVAAGWLVATLAGAAAGGATGGILGALTQAGMSQRRCCRSTRKVCAVAEPWSVPASTTRTHRGFRP